MSTEQRIQTLAGVGNEANRICAVLNQKNVGYLDLLEAYNVTGNNIYHLWIRCGRDDDNLMYLLEAYRNELAQPAEILQKRAPECRELIAKGKRLPRSKRLA